MSGTTPSSHPETTAHPGPNQEGLRAMMERHTISGAQVMRGQPQLSWRMPIETYARPLQRSDLRSFVAGMDVFSRQSDGRTVAQQYRDEGIRLTAANMDRVNGWAEILNRLGDPAAGLRPRLFIHQRCTRLLDCLPLLQHDPNRPEDVLKVDADEEGAGGDDAADALRYLVATKSNRIYVRKLTGL